MQTKNINVQKLKASESSFFKMWLMMLQPFLNLRTQELEVLGKLLYHRYRISKEVNNENIINELLFNNSTRKQIRKELDINVYSFNNALTDLRKKKLIVNNTLNPKIIPNTSRKNFDTFKFTYEIEITG